ncbi:hypothetical protein PAXINDRAFT_13728 [Paxillus involutus ATCC 200175]|uniref:Unplaced genomic scaffold PAXINscaffold_30, whole genome shotgun sequence n=1 Tax=Paxillus involutus ATCC 200175 TaxID=664439 RepID=A0A0C9SVI8_PAXIN|nr:hypothetical protein PAXINDRAFT_13728 [Paxillus involutus ATCC 200175]
MDVPQPHRRRPTQGPNAHAGPKRVNVLPTRQCYNDSSVNLDMPGPLTCNAHWHTRRQGEQGERGQQRKASTTSHGTTSVGAAGTAMHDVRTQRGDNKGKRDYYGHRQASQGSHTHVSTTATFASYRFILVSRSPYFRAQLLSWVPKSTATTAPGDPLTVTLPSPPFTPVSLHFTLGYIHTGTLLFSHRTCDLDTAFAILRAATYLSLPQLYDDETQARVVYEMLHCYTFLEFEEFERITGAKWGTARCHCRQCVHRVPCALEFALADDIANKYLNRGFCRSVRPRTTPYVTTGTHPHVPPYCPSIHDPRSNATRSSMQPCRT